jgi:hypothetical protein
VIRLRRQPRVSLRKGKHRAPDVSYAPGIRATTRDMKTVAISPQTRLRTLRDAPLKPASRSLASYFAKIIRGENG